MTQLKPQNLTGYYAVIRHSSDGDDYIDIETLSGSSEVAMQTARDTDKRLPVWARDNKINGLAKVDLSIVNTEIVKVTP